MIVIRAGASLNIFATAIYLQGSSTVVQLVSLVNIFHVMLKSLILKAAHFCSK